MRQNSKISKHISYTEATKSVTAIKQGIDNIPDFATLDNMKYIAENIFESVRGRFCVPIAVSSFYRSIKLNKAIGGSATSQHCKGEAIDLDADVYGMLTNREIFDYIRTNLKFDQLIWEYGTDEEPDWVHVSLKEYGPNRGKVLVAFKEKSWTGAYKTKYKYYEN